MLVALMGGPAMERARKILDALSFAYLGAFAILLYLHATLNPNMDEVERLLSWAEFGWIPFTLGMAFLTPSHKDAWRLEMTPALIGAIVVVVGGIAALAAMAWGLIPAAFNTPLMVVPFCLVVAWPAARFASRRAGEIGDARFAPD
jgi:hypothetical protein